MSTDQLAVSKRRRRIDRTSEFKDQIVASCLQVGVSVTAIASAHDLNPSLVHRWVRDHERRQKILSDENTVSSVGAIWPFLVSLAIDLD